MSTSEYKLHIAVIAHINSTFIGTQNPNLKFWHVANQVRDAKEAFFNKKMGVLAGVPDLMFGWPVSKVGVLELKAKGGHLSSPQNRFMSWAHSIGWRIGEARSVRDAHNVLISWGLVAAHHSIIEPDYSTEQEKFRQAIDMFKPE